MNLTIIIRKVKTLTEKKLLNFETNFKLKFVKFDTVGRNSVNRLTISHHLYLTEVGVQLS